MALNQTFRTWPNICAATHYTTSEELTIEAVIDQVQISENNDRDIEDINDQGDELPFVSNEQTQEALNLVNFILQNVPDEDVMSHIRAL